VFALIPPNEPISGDYTLGDYTLGDYTLGDYTLGDYTLGDYTLGDSHWAITRIAPTGTLQGMVEWILNRLSL
jgi:hypothetical protein